LVVLGLGSGSRGKIFPVPVSKPPVAGFGDWGLRFGVRGPGFGVWGLGFGVWGLGFGVWGLESGVQSSAFSAQG